MRFRILAISALVMLALPMANAQVEEQPEPPSSTPATSAPADTSKPPITSPAPDESKKPAEAPADDRKPITEKPPSERPEPRTGKAKSAAKKDKEQEHEPLDPDTGSSTLSHDTLGLLPNPWTDKGVKFALS